MSMMDEVSNLLGSTNLWLMDANQAQDYKRVHWGIESIVRDCNFVDMQGNPLKNVKVQTFGSSSNGFGMKTSDLDITLLTQSGSQINGAVCLKEVASAARARGGFVHITSILQAQVPVLKMTDLKTGIEVDLCVNNYLGVKNTELMSRYCALDERVKALGNVIKTWAKRREIIGVSEGYLSSYAYMLMVIYFLQRKGIIPNLQNLAEEKGMPQEYVDHWDVTFYAGDQIPRSTAKKQKLLDLVIDFFKFYKDFDWKNNAVAIRVGPADCPKVTLFDRNGVVSEQNFLGSMSGHPAAGYPGVATEHWWIQDPFDLAHNLAGKCTVRGKKHIHNTILETLSMLNKAKQTKSYRNNSWLGPEIQDNQLAYLRFRIFGDGGPDGNEILAHFFDCHIRTVNVISQKKYRDVFLIFGNVGDRRMAHAKNETHIGDWQLQMSRTTNAAYLDAVVCGVCQTFKSPMMFGHFMKMQNLAHQEPPDATAALDATAQPFVPCVPWTAGHYTAPGLTSPRGLRNVGAASLTSPATTAPSLTSSTGANPQTASSAAGPPSTLGATTIGGLFSPPELPPSMKSKFNVGAKEFVPGKISKETPATKESSKTTVIIPSSVTAASHNPSTGSYAPNTVTSAPVSATTTEEARALSSLSRHDYTGISTEAARPLEVTKDFQSWVASVRTAHDTTDKEGYRAALEYRCFLQEHEIATLNMKIQELQLQITGNYGAVAGSTRTANSSQYTSKEPSPTEGGGVMTFCDSTNGTEWQPIYDSPEATVGKKGKKGKKIYTYAAAEGGSSGAPTLHITSNPPSSEKPSAATTAARDSTGSVQSVTSYVPLEHSPGTATAGMIAAAKIAAEEKGGKNSKKAKTTPNSKKKKSCYIPPPPAQYNWAAAPPGIGSTALNSSTVTAPAGIGSASQTLPPAARHGLAGYPAYRMPHIYPPPGVMGPPTGIGALGPPGIPSPGIAYVTAMQLQQLHHQAALVARYPPPETHEW